MKWLLCGRYACRIITNADINRIIPENWMNHSRDFRMHSGEITIRLNEMTFDNSERLPNGWTGSNDRERWQAAYAYKGKKLITLVSKSPNEVIACVEKKAAMNSRLGIQYGMITALYKECIGLHGVTLLCGNEVIILSAPSGTGKTTLAKLLGKYSDAIVINGDFAMLSSTNEGVIFEPTPFCGNSGRALNRRFRVNRVVFLRQGHMNHWRELDGREAMKLFMSNTFIPVWSPEMQTAVQENVLKCIRAIKTETYDFLPTKEAAEYFLKKIEEDDSPFSE